MNLTDRAPYNVQKFATGIVSQPGWATQKPTAFKTVLETLIFLASYISKVTHKIVCKYKSG